MIVGRSSSLSQLLVVGLLLLPAGSALATRIMVNGTVKMEDGSPVVAAQIIVLDLSSAADAVRLRGGNRRRD